MSHPPVPKLLLIVDDWEALDRYEAELGRGFEFVPVFFGQDGMSTALESRPDAALIDLVSGECDGVALEAEFRAHPVTRALPIALVLPEGCDDPANVSTRVYRRPFGYESLRDFFLTPAKRPL